MQRIYEPESLLEAELLIGMLRSEGIQAHLSGRDLMGAVGELPMQGLLGLAVPDAQAMADLSAIVAYVKTLPAARADRIGASIGIATGWRPRPIT